MFYQGNWKNQLNMLKIQLHPQVTIISFVAWEWFSPHAGERAKHRSREYQELKASLANRMWELAQRVYPQLADAPLSYFDAGSPATNLTYCKGKFTFTCTAERLCSPIFHLQIYTQTLHVKQAVNCKVWLQVTNNYYLGATRGEIYGAAHVTGRYGVGGLVAQRPSVAAHIAPNVVSAGQDTLCGGVATGLVTGLLGAGEVLGSKLGTLAGFLLSGAKHVPGMKL